MKVYGPYKRKDGRQHVVVDDGTGKLKTVSYPKYLVEQLLGRKLDPEKETIDHIDGDFTNNSLENLRVIDRVKHASEDVVRRKPVKCKCVYCGAKCTPVKKNGNGRKCAGPFCSKSCIGKYTRDIKKDPSKKLQPCNWKSMAEYYTLKELDIPKSNVINYDDMAE
jgi:hypothetical protein